MINTKDSAAKNEEEDWIKRGKKRLAIFLKNYAFVTVLCMASVSLLARFFWSNIFLITLLCLIFRFPTLFSTSLD